MFLIKDCHTIIAPHQLLVLTAKATSVRTTERTIVARRKVIGQEALERTVRARGRLVVVQRRRIYDIRQTRANRTTQIAYGTVRVLTPTTTTVQARGRSAMQ